MRQVLFTIPIFGGLKVFGYGVMLFVAFLLSTNLAAWRAKKEKLDPELLYDLALWIFVGGLVGARLFYVIQYWGDRIHSLVDIVKIWEGGIVLYGSIMGGTAAFFICWLIHRFPLRPLLDVIAPSLAIGIAIGRLGCFLNGCCYGDLCDSPFGVAFPRESPPWRSQLVLGMIGPDALRSLPVHPTQIYSALDGFLLCALLSAYFPIRRRDGEVMALLMVTYPVTRFLIEYLRNDEGAYFAGLTISQNISVGLFLCGLAFWHHLKRLPTGRYADLPDDPVPAPDLAMAGDTRSL